MLANIGAVDITIPARKLLKPIYGSMCSLASAIGVAIRNKNIFEAWLDYLTQGMMDHAIAKTRGTDFAAFGLVDEKMGIGSWQIGTCKQFPP